MKTTLRSLAAGLTLAAATTTGLTLTTTTASADDTATVETVDDTTDLPAITTPTLPTVRPLDTYWG
ncbi:hypothetical protein P1P75_33435 [Streptomyces sp. ID05-39B]|uniref:hypothetical protein n=1 Tax=Streptomyces sp. ID05-39B TaxID=3028664 RepID=UPI0029BDE0CD|nr:hypothetical protein [Streptomyces sp. ID05-39B]MDX3531177.1 hypothetical protein [Streptomyces sp. ID05-39B]